MNCRPNDIARIVAPYNPRAVGLYVRVLWLAEDNEFIEGIEWKKVDGAPAWVCSGIVPAPDEGFLTQLVISDVCLEPQRGEVAPCT